MWFLYVYIVNKYHVCLKIMLSLVVLCFILHNAIQSCYLYSQNLLYLTAILFVCFVWCINSQAICLKTLSMIRESFLLILLDTFWVVKFGAWGFLLLCDLLTEVMLFTSRSIFSEYYTHINFCSPFHLKMFEYLYFKLVVHFYLFLHLILYFLFLLGTV